MIIMSISLSSTPGYLAFLGQPKKGTALVSLSTLGNAFKVLDLERRGILISKMEAVLKQLLEQPYQRYLEEELPF